MIKEPKLQNVKTLAKDITAINAAKTVFKAMAYEQAVSAVVKPEQRRVLADLQIKDDAGEVITDPDRLYMAPDDDFNKYLTLMHSFYIAKGFKLPEFGYCPLLIAEDLTRKAKHVLIDVCEPFTGIAHENLFTDFPNNYNHYVDITLRLFANSAKP